MLIASGFSWFHLLPGGESADFLDGHGFVFYSAWFACLLLLSFAFVARSALTQVMERDGMDRYQADGRLSVRTLAELLVGGLMGMMGGVLGRDDVKRYMPLVGGLFLYIWVCNLLAVVPGFQPPTDNINTNIGMALIVLAAYWVVGVVRGGKDFWGHVFGPVPLLMPLIAFIELLGLLIVRPATLTIRLTANIFGDHAVFTIMSGLVPLLIPVPLLMLAIIVSTIQAFVFALLTSIYLSLSLPHHGHDAHDHH